MPNERSTSTGSAALPADPENMNDKRAEFAGNALKTFEEETGSLIAEKTALPDLLCNLMHWCDRNAVRFDDALASARMHYEEETADDV